MAAVRKGDLVLIEHTRSIHYQAKRTTEQIRVFGIVEAATREGLVKSARSGQFTYYGAGAPHSRQGYYSAEMLSVGREQLNCSPAEVMAALGAEPWPHKPEFTRDRSFPSADAAREALRPFLAPALAGAVAS